MKHSIFSDGTTEKKLAILGFLKEQETIVCFECKNTVIKFWENRDIVYQNIFQESSLKFEGQISKISEDGLLYLLHNNGTEISIPLEHLSNISLQK